MPRRRPGCGTQFLQKSLVSLILLVSPAGAQEFDAVLEEYLSGYWRANPSRAATPAGVHAYDAQLEDLSAAAVEAEIQRNRAFLARFERLPAQSLAPAKRVDLEIALDRIRLELLELEERRSWKRHPQFYVSLAGEAVLGLVRREFTPAERRFQNVAARLKLIPRLLEQARANLENPPELCTREALEKIPDMADFLEKQVPQAAAEQGASRKRQRRVASEAARAAAALRRFGEWLQAQMLPRSKGESVLGAELYGRMFRYSLGTALSPEEVLAAAERDLGATQEEMRRLAAQVAPGRPLAEVLEGLGREQPGRQDELAAFRAAVAEVRRFVEEKRLSPLPRPDRLRVLPAPFFYAFARGEAVRAFLDSPGPFEPDLPSSYYVWLPQNLSGDALEDLLRGRNAFDVLICAAQETYPGRYTQLGAMHRAPHLARKVFASRAFIEGWAHYAEQMLFEEGFRAGAPARLAQLQTAAAAQLEAIVDIRLHTSRLSRADAVKLLAAEAFLPQATAERKVALASLSPVELSAAYVGRLEILRLREEMRKKQGPAFSLGEFHERLLEVGAPPIRYARSLLLGEKIGTQMNAHKR